ncbi:D-2-hydroxyacid dehydrogenase [Polaribacter aquimarinus]|uniref:Glycerate dehydrogenase n=1 Tax=Polaribacter aquimarinus TaxID=2100726 RepID=A0A2U2JD42_9FLAO|nr:D-2-hydroxyacid dehydrogenase [Polaribacter aquimarinus]PWG06270.1 glycerate dehydrogenase [Polaribacter aquimarinus]
MKIVVLDGYTLNPGDISWTALEELGDVTIYDRTAYDSNSIIENIADATIVFTNKTPLNEEVLAQVPSVEYIGVLATGFNVVAIEAAKRHNIIVTNIPDYSSGAVAQFTMALLLELCHHIGAHHISVKNGDWVSSKDFSYWNSPLIELSGKTIGLIGFGKIGQATAKLAIAFGLKVLVYSRTIYKDFENENLQFVALDDLLLQSDFVSLHCPLNKETEGIINAENISKMKKTAILINTSRGPLVDEKDLANALNTNNLMAAAVDVISEEPMKKDNPLRNAKNCIITPHIAWASKEARLRLMNTAIGNLEAFIENNPINVVS